MYCLSINIVLFKHDVLFKYQFGFRKNHSTEQAIMEITDNLKASIDSNLVSCGLFLDFSKAFDTVNHQILLDKLCKYMVSVVGHMIGLKAISKIASNLFKLEMISRVY